MISDKNFDCAIIVQFCNGKYFYVKDQMQGMYFAKRVLEFRLLEWIEINFFTFGKNLD